MVQLAWHNCDTMTIIFFMWAWCTLNNPSVATLMPGVVTLWIWLFATWIYICGKYGTWYTILYGASSFIFNCLQYFTVIRDLWSLLRQIYGQSEGEKTDGELGRTYALMFQENVCHEFYLDNQVFLEVSLNWKMLQILIRLKGNYTNLLKSWGTLLSWECWSTTLLLTTIHLTCKYHIRV